MKFFAKLGLNSKVVGRIHIHNSDAPTEEAGIEFLNKTTNYPFWKEYKKDGSIRKNKAGIGFTYDEDRDAFITPQPYVSWVLNETTCGYESPVAYPETFTQDRKNEDGSDAPDRYYWNEQKFRWEL